MNMRSRINTSYYCALQVPVQSGPFLKSSHHQYPKFALKQLPRTLRANQALLQWLEGLKVNIEVVHRRNHVGMEKIEALQVVHMRKSLEKTQLQPLSKTKNLVPLRMILSLKNLPWTCHNSH